MLLISQNIPPNVITPAEHQKMKDFQPSHRPRKTQLIACIFNKTVWSNELWSHGFSVETADLWTYPSETSEVKSWVCQYSPGREKWFVRTSFHEKVNNTVLLISFWENFPHSDINWRVSPQTVMQTLDISPGNKKLYKMLLLYICCIPLYQPLFVLPK